MKRVAIVTIAVALFVLLAASPTQAAHEFEGADRIAGPTTSTGIPFDAETVLEGGDRVAGPTSETGIPDVPVLVGLPIGSF